MVCPTVLKVMIRLMARTFHASLFFIDSFRSTGGIKSWLVELKKISDPCHFDLRTTPVFLGSSRIDASDLHSLPKGGGWKLVPRGFFQPSRPTIGYQWLRDADQRLLTVGGWTGCSGIVTSFSHRTFIATTRARQWGVYPMAESGALPYAYPMKFTMNQGSVIQYALLLGTITTLLTGCFFWRGGDRNEHRDHDREEFHHDDDHR